MWAGTGIVIQINADSSLEEMKKHSFLQAPCGRGFPGAISEG
jgi:hypothetical protein